MSVRYPLERWILQLRHSSFLLQTRLRTKTTQHNFLPHSTNAMKKIKELREKTKSLEDSLIDTNNNTSTAMEEIMAKAAVVDHQDEDIR